MTLLISTAMITGAVLVGAMSPGPSFVVVARTAIARSRRDGIAAAFGMGTGGALFAAAALLGLHAVLTSVPSLYLMLRIGGAAYLLYLAVRLWHGAARPLDLGQSSLQRNGCLRRSFLLGLITQLSNLKTAIVYASVFSALLPASTPHWFGPFLVVLILVTEAGWYTVVATAFSLDGPRRGYLKSKAVVDRSAGAVMGLLGLKIVSEVR